MIIVFYDISALPLKGSKKTDFDEFFYVDTQTTAQAAIGGYKSPPIY
jgi:hypothetical protein